MSISQRHKVQVGKVQLSLTINQETKGTKLYGYITCRVVKLRPTLWAILKHIFSIVFGLKFIRPSFSVNVSEYLIGLFNLPDSEHGIFPVELRKVLLFMN